MDWRSSLRRTGILGLVVVFALWIVMQLIAPLFIAGLKKHLKGLTHGLVNASVHFQAYAFAPGHALGEAFFLLGLLLWVLIVVVGIPAFFLVIKKPSPPPETPLPVFTYFPNPDYYAFLRRFIQSVDGLDPNDPVPVRVLHQLVGLIRLYESEIITIVGKDNASVCRMLWIVRQEDEDETSRVFGRKANRLFDNEVKILNHCFETSVKAWDFAVDVPNDPKFRSFDGPERMQAVVFAHNSDNNIGFVLAIDRSDILTDKIRAYLEFHIAGLIHLWDLDMFQRVMLQLSEEHWEEVGL